MTSHLITRWAAFLIIAITEIFTQRLGDCVQYVGERTYMRKSELDKL